MHLTLTDITRTCGGRLHGQDRTVEGVTIDSRHVIPNQLFVPIVADRDGHQFIAAAVRAGAVAYLTAQQPRPDVNAAAVEVADTGQALLQLGGLARERLSGDVIGVTGSVGKTSVKDLLAAATAPVKRTAANEKSFNNELGVPLTLCQAPDDTEVAIIEMGARGIGHIELLARYVRPTVGVVTAVELAHTELFGTIENVAKAKGELVECLPASGTAVLAGDLPMVAGMAARTQARVLTYGASSANDVTASEVIFDELLRPRYRLHSPWGEVLVTLAVSGRHQVHNSLAAAAGALAVGLAPEQVAIGLGSARLSPWRMELSTLSSGATLLNDSYNANPTSMRAALDALVGLPGRRRLAVLGEMGELGIEGPASHIDIARYAHDLGVELIAVDTPHYGIEPVEGIEGAVAAVGTLGEGDIVLVKASRSVGLERLAVALSAT